MRFATACAVVVLACLAVGGAVVAQKGTVPAAAQGTSVVPQSQPPRSAQPSREATAAPITPAAAPAAPNPALAAVPALAPPAPLPVCTNPNGLGVARVVEIDTTGGPGFGFEHFKAHDFLRPGEVVLTFDDGPWPRNTPAVLEALAGHCTRATFFPIGKHAVWHPEILKQVAAAGHSIGSHTWSHADLSKKPFEEAREDIEKGISAVRYAIGAQAAPFFRFPALRHPPDLLAYLAERNIGVFSTDMDSFDFKMRRPEQVTQAVLAKLKKSGKGIVLMHDFQQATAGAGPELLRQLKANGYKIVHMKGKDALQTLPKYDEIVMKELGPGVANARPTSTIVRTISE